MRAVFYFLNFILKFSSVLLLAKVSCYGSTTSVFVIKRTLSVNQSLLLAEF